MHISTQIKCHIYLIQKLSAYHLEVYENSINVLKGCFRSNYKGHILQSIQMLIPILRASTKVH